MKILDGLWRYSILWVSLLTTLLIVFAFTIAINHNQEAVNRHLDEVVAQQVRANSGTSEAAKKLFNQVDSICKSLAISHPEIKCG